MLDDDALEARLRDVWGFGAWSSEFILLRGFGRLSRAPVSERRLRQAVATLYELEIKGKRTRMILWRLGERYGRYIGYWAHYIRVWIDRYEE